MKKQSIRTKLKNLTTDVDEMIDTFAAVKGHDAALSSLVLLDVLQLAAIATGAIEDDERRQLVQALCGDISRNIFENLAHGLDLPDEDRKAALKLAQTIYEKVSDVAKRT